MRTCGVLPVQADQVRCGEWGRTPHPRGCHVLPAEARRCPTHLKAEHQGGARQTALLGQLDRTLVVRLGFAPNRYAEGLGRAEVLAADATIDLHDRAQRGLAGRALLDHLAAAVGAGGELGWPFELHVASRKATATAEDDRVAEDAAFVVLIHADSVRGNGRGGNGSPANEPVGAYATRAPPDVTRLRDVETWIFVAVGSVPMVLGLGVFGFVAWLMLGKDADDIEESDDGGGGSRLHPRPRRPGPGRPRYRRGPARMPELSPQRGPAVRTAKQLR